MTKTVLLSAGGTGGHLFPAHALAQELVERGVTVHLATDERAERFAAEFPASEIHIIRSATFRGRSPIALMRTFTHLLQGYLQSRKLMSQLKPHAVVGFGGYPTVPPLLAASHKGVPTILHEQNAIMGRANRFLASRVTAIASGFPIQNQDGLAGAALTVSGNPLRELAHNAANRPYVAAQLDDPFHLLVFGGSQGARFFSDILPEALAELERTERDRLTVTLQARPEDAERTRTALLQLEVESEVNDFYRDMPDRISRSHLVICRSGASSVSELALIGRPSLLVPLPGALDDDQGANAAGLAAAGGATMIRQRELTPNKLAKMLSDAMKDPESLAIQAENAKKAGVPDAAPRLADLVHLHI